MAQTPFDPFLSFILDSPIKAAGGSAFGQSDPFGLDDQLNEQETETRDLTHDPFNLEATTPTKKALSSEPFDKAVSPNAHQKQITEREIDPYAIKALNINPRSPGEKSISEVENDPFSISKLSSPSKEIEPVNQLTKEEKRVSVFDPFAMMLKAQQQNEQQQQVVVYDKKSELVPSSNPFGDDGADTNQDNKSSGVRDISFDEDDDDNKPISSFSIEAPKPQEQKLMSAQGYIASSVTPTNRSPNKPLPSAAAVVSNPKQVVQVVGDIKKKVVGSKYRLSRAGLVSDDYDEEYSDSDDEGTPKKKNQPETVTSNPFAMKENMVANPFSRTDPLASVFEEEALFQLPKSNLDGRERTPEEEEEEKVRNAKRLNLLKELWDTEKLYVTELDMLVNRYLIPLRDSLKKRKSMISANDVPKLFNNVEQIYSVNSEIMTQMDIILENGFEKEMSQSILKEISQIFIKMQNNLRVYAEYCVNNPISVELLQNCLKNKEFAAYEEITRKACNNMKLEQLITRPIQRLPKYLWFFKEMMKVTRPDEQCSDNLVKAFETLKKVTLHINDYRAIKENQNKLEDIEKSLHGYKGKIAEKGRQLVREGILHKYSGTSSKDAKKADQRKFYLFNDLLLWSEVNHGFLRYKDSVPAISMLVRDNPDERYEFQIKRLDNKKVYTIICSSEPEKNLWVNDIQKVIDDVSLRQDKASQLAKQLQMKEWASK